MGVVKEDAQAERIVIDSSMTATSMTIAVVTLKR